MPVINYLKGLVQKIAYANGFALVCIGLFISGKMAIDPKSYPQELFGILISYWLASSFLILLFFFFNYRKRRLYFRIASIGFLISISATILEAFNKCSCAIPVLDDGFSNCQILAIIYAGLFIFKKLE